MCEVIPAEAVEAAAEALDPHTMGSEGLVNDKFKDAVRAEAICALEAAAPHMLANVWDVGYMAGREDESSTHVPFMNHTHATNPYRSEA